VGKGLRDSAEDTHSEEGGEEAANEESVRFFVLVSYNQRHEQRISGTNEEV